MIFSAIYSSRWLYKLVKMWSENKHLCAGSHEISERYCLKSWVPLGLGHKPSMPNHPFPVKTPPASLQLDPGCDGNVMCQNTSLERCPEAILTRSKPSRLCVWDQFPSTETDFRVQGQIAGVKLALKWKEKFDLIGFQNFIAAVLLLTVFNSFSEDNSSKIIQLDDSFHYRIEVFFFFF